jgi:ABC-type multidrug transport system fused ATPase/permease subunit
MKELLLEKKKSFIQYVFACFFFVVSDVLQAFVFAMIFQTIENGTMEYFTKTVWACVGYVVLSGALFLASRMLRIAFMRDVLLSVRIRAFDKILNMSYQTFHKKSRDVYLSNLTNDINTFENTFFISLLNFILPCGTFLAILTILMIVQWQVGLIILAVSLIVLGISKLFEDRTVKLQEQKSTENEKFTVNVANTFTGLEILKLNNIERQFLNRSKAQIDHLEKTKRKFSFFTALQNHTNEAIGATVMFGLLLFLMYSPGNPVGFGRIALIIQLSGSAVFPMVRMLPLLNVLKSSATLYTKITKPEEAPEEETARPHPYRFSHELRVRGLRFFYEQKEVFRHLDFTIQKGKKYLIKGPSGAGKSTL